MADNKIRLPSSGGGLISFSDSTGSKLQIKPEQVLIMILAVILIEVLLHTLGYSWFGFSK
ncbi:MAG: preprotein translocase subunit Sec61beta [Candidatus Woesearchaeota archaeon]